MSDCNCDFKKIEKLCAGEKYSPGVYPRLFATCASDVATIPAPASGTSLISTNITMRSAVVGPPAITAGKFYEWEFEMKNAEYSCEKDDNGLWNTNLKIFLTKLTPEKTHALSHVNGPSCIVVCEDMNQEGKRIIGDKVNGCDIMVKEQTSPRNGYEVNIKWQSAEPPYWYSGTIQV